MKKMLIAAAALTVALPAQAQTIHIGFDTAQAGYVPQIDGQTQEITNQFASLGVVFADRATPGRGAMTGRCGPANGALGLFGFGADFGGCGDTTPDFDILFVDPANAARAGYTTAVSLYTFDGLIRLTAYDVAGAVLGAVERSEGTLSLAGIGNISRVNVRSLDGDPTTLDDLRFNSVVAINNGVPEPATWAMMIGGFGLAGTAMRRRAAKVAFA